MWPQQPNPPHVPTGPGCNQFVSTKTLLRSFWVEVVSGLPLYGQPYFASIGFCDPALPFKTLNGYSTPAGVWMYESQGRLILNQSHGNPVGEPFGRYWGARANLSAEIIGGDHSSSFLEFALNGVVQGRVELGFSVPATGSLVGCASVCSNATVLSLRGVALTGSGDSSGNGGDSSSSVGGGDDDSSISRRKKPAATVAGSRQRATP